MPTPTAPDPTPPTQEDCVEPLKHGSMKSRLA